MRRGRRRRRRGRKGRTWLKEKEMRPEGKDTAGEGERPEKGDAAGERRRGQIKETRPEGKDTVGEGDAAGERRRNRKGRTRPEGKDMTGGEGDVAEREKGTAGRDAAGEDQTRRVSLWRDMLVMRNYSVWIVRWNGSPKNFRFTPTKMRPEDGRGTRRRRRGRGGVWQGARIGPEIAPPMRR